jgi:hypothetical protein
MGLLVDRELRMALEREGRGAEASHLAGGEEWYMRNPNGPTGSEDEKRNRERARARLESGEAAPTVCSVCGEEAGSTGSLAGRVHRWGPRAHAFEPKRGQ